jgi:hypothetical protein
MKKYVLYFLINLFVVSAFGQELVFQNQKFEAKNVTASIVKLNGENVIKVERDLKALPFDTARLGSTVDEPTYFKLIDVDFEDGIIEVKMYSQIQNPSPFRLAQGFIGIAFRIDHKDDAYESIYLRLKVGRSENQLSRNHTVQYYAYPEFKFDKLRKEAPGMYETTAPVNINEWITMRMEVSGEKVYLYINDAKYSTFVVEKMKGKTKHGSVALWVDIGTIGYFKDLKVIKSE